MNHAKIGDLTFRTDEYRAIACMLGIGADAMKRDVIFRTDDERFREWAEKQAKANEDG